MSLGVMQATAITTTAQAGPEFLRELRDWLSDEPGNSYSGSPQEILDQVVRRSDRFSSCDRKVLDNLRRSMSMWIKSKGGEYGLRIVLPTQMTDTPSVKVWLI